jgi:hypothetical protein
MPRGSPSALAGADRHRVEGYAGDTRLRRQRQAERIWNLGARVLYELLREIEKYGIVDLDVRLERYARLDPDILRLVQADRFPPSPIRLVALVRAEYAADLGAP